MKQIMDKLKQVIKKERKVIIFVLGTALIGFITGCIFTTILSSNDEVLVKEYISEFISKIDAGKLDYINSLKNSIISNIFFLLTLWIFGISVIGIPLNLFVYFTKSFMLGFSISAFVLNYGVKGCLISFVYVFPHHIINILIYTVLLLFTMDFSKKLILSLKSKKSLTFQKSFKRYSVILVLCIIVTVITGLVEVFITPFLMDKILFIIK